MANTNAFLPDIPVTTSYMRLNQGSNKFRILGDTIDGYEYWEDVDGGRKPVRLTKEDAKGKTYSDTPKYFWAMVVYNYEAEVVQILQLTQKTIQTYIKEYSISDDYGDPHTYDITITKEGEGLNTEYRVMASPPKPVDEAVEKMFKDMKINIKKLYSTKEEPHGGDPFVVSDEITPEEVEEFDPKEVAKE